MILWLIFLLVVIGTSLVIFPCLVLAGKADRQMQCNWDDWTGQHDDRLLNGRTRRGNLSRCHHVGKARMRKRQSQAVR